NFELIVALRDVDPRHKAVASILDSIVEEFIHDIRKMVRHHIVGSVISYKCHSKYLRDDFFKVSLLNQIHFNESKPCANRIEEGSACHSASGKLRFLQNCSDR